MSEYHLHVNVRFSILQRDGFECLMCGVRPGSALLGITRVLPSTRRGSDNAQNLWTCCLACISGKTDQIHVPTRWLITREDHEGFAIWRQFGRWNYEVSTDGMIINFAPRNGYYWIGMDRFYERGWIEHIQRKVSTRVSTRACFVDQDVLDLANALDFGRAIVRQ